MAIVTAATNRVDSFAKFHGISEADVVRWNLQYFVDNRTLFLPLGVDFAAAAPLGQSGRDLLVDDQVLLVDGRILTIR